MKTTPRFEKAISRLYPAFHNGELNAFSCTYCAVGNMCNNENDWGEVRTSVGNYITLEDSLARFELDSVKEVVERDYKKGLKLIKETGYSPLQIVEVERVFMKPFNNNSCLRDNKDLQFEGLCNVIAYLASLDNISNPMDYSKVFERTTKDTPKYSLEEVLV